MPVTESLTFTIGANDNTTDNLGLTPTDGHVFVQLARGYAAVLSSYRLVLCNRNAAGQLQIETDLGSGAYPSPTDPAAPAPFLDLGPAPALVDRVLIAMVDAISTPPGTPGSIAIILSLYQELADQSYHRAGTATIETHATSVTGRFEFTLNAATT